MAESHILNRLENLERRAKRNENEIAALEEAICPRVAARLTDLERSSQRAAADRHEMQRVLSDFNRRLNDIGSRVPKMATPAKPAPAHKEIKAIDALADALERSMGTTSVKNRKPCTRAQVNLVALKLHQILGIGDWESLPEEGRVDLRTTAHQIIHAVLDVMDRTS